MPPALRCASFPPVNVTNDTITAISTAPGEAGIAIVRLSGPESFSIASKVIKGKCRFEGGTFFRGFIKDDSGKDIDEVIALVYKAPHSYTREDVIEIQCHGGRVSSARILRKLLESGARLAEPGEFTKRAFLNGRIDLLQAEAVADLIQAKTDQAANLAIEQLEGRLSSLISNIYDNILSLGSDLEVSLDFSEMDSEIDEHVIFASVVTKLTCIRNGIDGVLASWNEGHLLRDGALVVISGEPNAGKSTLMNLLLGKQRSIVTSTPGTTRDTIEETCIVNGIPLRLVDTAGIRDTACHIEREGVNRAIDYTSKADLNLVVVDGSKPLDSIEIQRIKSLDPAHTLIVISKADLPQQISDCSFGNSNYVSCNLLHANSLSVICNMLSVILTASPAPEPHAAISERHRNLLVKARAGIYEAEKLIGEGQEDSTVLVANLLKESAGYVGQIIGRTYDAELLDQIFAKFCIGK